MIYLKTIELTNFKGVLRVRCEFDDLTVLAGLNNSGKTTILQAVYLLLAAMPRIAEACAPDTFKPEHLERSPCSRRFRLAVLAILHGSYPSSIRR